MFTCPNCGCRLVASRSERGTFWVCGGCKGRAANVTVLRRAVRRDYVNEFWQQVQRVGVPGHRPCPACRRPMAAVRSPVAAGDCWLDVCRACQFVWFDPTEFEAAPAAPRPQTPQQSAALQPKVREVLALAAIERLREQAEADPVPDSFWKYFPGGLGLPVECRDDQLQRKPWITWGLAIVISLVTLVAWIDLKRAVEELGFIPAQLFPWGFPTMLTSFLLHAGVIHLVGNLYFLLVFGDNVEDYLGRQRFVGLLFGSAAVGDLLHALVNPSSTVPCIGASGGISGVLCFYALQFPHARLGLALRVGFIPIRWIALPAWGYLAFWAVLQGFGLLQQISGVSPVSAAAHVGGALTGLAVWLWARRNRPPQMFSPTLGGGASRSGVSAASGADSAPSIR